MAFDFPKREPETMEERLHAIQTISVRTANFWKSAHGWAPKEAADLLSKSRLDWLVSFNRTLTSRVQEVIDNPDEPAVIILAWAHLRTLVEGHLKLFLAVFLNDYLADAHAPLKRGTVIGPDALHYEAIKKFLIQRRLLVDHHVFIGTVQRRGNAIHAFADRPIGSAAEYLEHVTLYWEFLTDLEASLPNPYA